MMDRGNSTQGGALLVINEGISDTYSVHVNTKDLTMLKGHSIKKNLIILQERQYPYSTDQYG